MTHALVDLARSTNSVVESKNKDMKVIFKNQTEKFKNNDFCVATEYPLGDKDIDGSMVELSGRYPKKGRVVNLKSRELVFVIDGFGKIVVEGKEVNLQQGDLVLIEAEEKYFWDGKMTMFISCTPAWNSAQHKEVE